MLKRKIATALIMFIALNIDAVEAKKSHSQWSATYYGNKYRTTRRTANGEVFNMHAMTCAAPRKYKFGTKLRVTNLTNHKYVIVRVNDRGGFGCKVIDLTYDAFGKIAKHKLGRIKVKIEVVHNDSARHKHSKK